MVRNRYSVSGEEVEGMGVEMSFEALIISCDCRSAKGNSVQSGKGDIV